MALSYIPGSRVMDLPGLADLPNYDAFGPMAEALRGIADERFRRDQLAEQGRQADMEMRRAQIGAGTAADRLKYDRDKLGYDQGKDRQAQDAKIGELLRAYSNAVSSGNPEAAAAIREQGAAMGIDPARFDSITSQGAWKAPAQLGAGLPPPQATAPQPPALAPGNPPPAPADALGTSPLPPRSVATSPAASARVLGSGEGAAAPAQLGGGLPPPASVDDRVKTHVKAAAQAAGLDEAKAEAIASAAAEEARGTTALSGQEGVSEGDRLKRGLDRGKDLISAAQRPVMQATQIAAGVAGREDQQTHQREMQGERLATVHDRMEHDRIDRHVKDMATANDWKRANGTDAAMDELDNAIANGDTAAVVQAMTKLTNPGGGALTERDSGRWMEANPGILNVLRTKVQVAADGSLPVEYQKAVQAFASHVREVQAVRFEEMRGKLGELITTQFGPERSDLFDYAMAKARSMNASASMPDARPGTGNRPAGPRRSKEALKRSLMGLPPQTGEAP